MTAGDYWPNLELNKHNLSNLKNITGISKLNVAVAVFVKITIPSGKT